MSFRSCGRAHAALLSVLDMSNHVVQVTCVCLHCCAPCDPGIHNANNPPAFSSRCNRVVLCAQSCVAFIHRPIGVCECVASEVLCAVLASACCSGLPRLVFVAVTAISAVIMHNNVSMLPRIESSRLRSNTCQVYGDAGAILNQARNCLLLITGPYLRWVVRWVASCLALCCSWVQSTMPTFGVCYVASLASHGCFLQLLSCALQLFAG